MKTVLVIIFFIIIYFSICFCASIVAALCAFTFATAICFFKLARTAARSAISGSTLALFFLEPSFLETWISFSIIFSVCIFSSWALFSLINYNITPITPIFFETFINILFFPLTYVFSYFFLTKFQLEKINKKKNV